MSTVALAIIPDRQKQVMSSLKEGSSLGDLSASAGSALSDVRRPTRGIVIKEDTYAVMRVLRADGSAIPLVNAGSRLGEEDDEGRMTSESYSNFLIQQVSEERVEKQQIVETFGEAFIFFFGERPRVLNVSGVLINTFDFNWEAEWWANYEENLRGTRCVEQGARIYLTFDETMVSGYLMATSSTKTSQERNYVPFSFQMFVVDSTTISQIGDKDPDPNWYTNTLIPGSEDEIFRPMQMPVTENPSLLSGPLSLIESVQQKVTAIQSFWNTLQDLTQNALFSIDSMLGGPVRVPQGFQGSLAFDEPDPHLTDIVGMPERITYTEKFGDNDDEFVGTNQQYSDAFFRTDFQRLSSVESQEAMFDAANAQWASYGYIIPPTQITAAIGVLSQTGIGMKLLTSARNGVAATSSVASTAALPVSAVLAGTSSVVSTAAIGVSLGQLLKGSETTPATDRAASVSATSAPPKASPTTQPGFPAIQVASAPSDSALQAFGANFSQDAQQQKLNSLKSQVA